MINHGILPILPLNFTKFVPFMPTLKKLASAQVVCNFPQNVVNAKIAQKSGNGKLRNCHGEVMDKMFCKVCENPGLLHRPCMSNPEWSVPKEYCDARYWNTPSQKENKKYLVIRWALKYYFSIGWTKKRT